MEIDRQEVHILLRISLIFKGIFALMEIVGGAFLYFVSQEQIINFINAFTQDELSEDPHDFISHYLLKASHGLFPDTRYFIAFYLLSHGLVKIVVIVGLLNGKRWAYPASIAVFTSFIVYQFYRFFIAPSAWLVILTVFDIAIIWLVWREYKSVKKRWIRLWN